MDFPKKLRADLKYHMAGSFLALQLPEKIPIEMTGLSETSPGVWEMEFKMPAGEGRLAIEGSAAELQKIADLINGIPKGTTTAARTQ